MDTYKIINQVRESLNMFDDAEFDMSLEDKNIVIKNLNNNKLWSLSFDVDENEKLTFDSSNSEIINENDEEEETEEENKEVLKESFQKMLSAESESEDFEEALDLLKNSIKKYKIKSKNTVVDKIEEENKINISEEDLEVVNKAIGKYDKVLKKYLENKNEFTAKGFLFDKNNEIKRSDKILDPITVLEWYKEKSNHRRKITEYSESIINFYNAVVEAYDETFTENVLPDYKSFGKSKFGINVTKNLVAYKKNYNEDINISELIVHLESIRAEHIGDVFEENTDLEVTNGSVQNDGNLKFLKFNSGLFTRKNIRQLLEDFDTVMGHFGHMNQGQFHTITEMRDTVDGMFRTNIIDEEVVAEIISNFNTIFGRQNAVK